MLEETVISQAIIDSYHDKLKSIIDVDAAVCGGGPAGLICAATLAAAGRRVVLFEKKLSLGGGMWGGGMMFNEIVVQKKAKKILEDFSIGVRKYREDYYVADSSECVCALGYNAIHNGAVVINGVFAEDVVIKENKVCGLVINWSVAASAGLYVDPLTIKAKFVVDATGHPCEVVKVVEEKSDVKIDTETGRVLGEKSMWAEVAENTIEENTREIAPGLFVAGMCANAVCGTPRMGPIFGGMLLSGRKCAELILSKLT